MSIIQGWLDYFYGRTIILVCHLAESDVYEALFFIIYKVLIFIGAWMRSEHVLRRVDVIWPLSSTSYVIYDVVTALILDTFKRS